MLTNFNQKAEYISCELVLSVNQTLKFFQCCFRDERTNKFAQNREMLVMMCKKTTCARSINVLSYYHAACSSFSRVLHSISYCRTIISRVNSLIAQGARVFSRLKMTFYPFAFAILIFSSKNMTLFVKLKYSLAFFNPMYFKKLF